MCTARSGSARKSCPSDAAAASREAESAPPLKPTTRPLTSAGAWAFKTACSDAAEKLIRLCVVVRAEAAQAGLPRIEQLRHGLIAQFGQMFDQTLLQAFGHQLRIPVRATMRFLQHFIHQP